jgi:hypothetical protein
VGAVALLLAIAGCTDDAASPKPLPSASSAAPSSASSSASPTGVPSMPAEARGTTAASAEAFVRHYVDLINYAMASGDTTQVTKLATANCSGCSVISKSIGAVYAKSGTVRGGRWEIRGLEPIKSTPTNAPRLRLRIHISKQVVIASPSAEPSTSVPSDGHLEVRLARSGGAWKVREMDAFE